MHRLAPLQDKVLDLMNGQSQSDFARKLGVSQPTVGRFFLYGSLGLKLARTLALSFPAIAPLVWEFYQNNAHTTGRPVLTAFLSILDVGLD